MVPANTNARVEVLSELQETDPNLNWLTRVTASDMSGVYILQGELINSGLQNQIRNLHADSGWTGFNYGNERASAPFAILDSIYLIYEKFMQENISLTMPELEIRWSPDSDGSFYNGDFIQISGLENIDTDEFDQHVVLHEWWHYYENEISRAESTGGPHTLVALLNPRIAYSEGTGNAWSGFILDDPIYRDISGPSQSGGFSFNMETNPFIATRGFYIENSIQEIVYDILDDNNEGVDNVTIPLQTMLEAWQSDSYLNQESLTTIYSLRQILEEFSPTTVAAINALYDEEVIEGTGFFGDGETNGRGLDFSLPVYHSLTVGAAPIEICSDNFAGEFNRLENRQLVRFEVDDFGFYETTVIRGPNNTNWNADIESDPEVVISSEGRVIDVGFTVFNNLEVLRVLLSPGVYVIDVFDFFNIDLDIEDNGADTGGLTCFNISVVEG